MKASELVKKVQELIDENGDMHVVKGDNLDIFIFKYHEGEENEEMVLFIE